MQPETRRGGRNGGQLQIQPTIREAHEEGAEGEQRLQQAQDHEAAEAVSPHICREGGTSDDYQGKSGCCRHRRNWKR